MIQQIPRCEKASEKDIRDWIAADGGSHQIQTDEEIMAIVQQDSDDNAEECDDGAQNVESRTDLPSDRKEYILERINEGMRSICPLNSILGEKCQKDNG